MLNRSQLQPMQSELSQIHQDLSDLHLSFIKTVLKVNDNQTRTAYLTVLIQAIEKIDNPVERDSVYQNFKFMHSSDNFLNDGIKNQCIAFVDYRNKLIHKVSRWRYYMDSIISALPDSGFNSHRVYLYEFSRLIIKDVQCRNEVEKIFLGIEIRMRDFQQELLRIDPLYQAKFSLFTSDKSLHQACSITLSAGLGSP